LLLYSCLDRYSQENRKSINAFSQEALKALMEYPWPGNVRELENVIERAVILAEGDHINKEDLPLNFQEEASPGKNFSGGPKSLREMRDEYIKEVVAAVGGNKRKAAAILKISPKTLHRFEQEKPI
jgi:DNA-binding NtrC family response regulator